MNLTNLTQIDPILLKFGHYEKATKIWNNLSLDLTLLSKRQIMWEIVSNFVAFLENLNFTAKALTK